MIDCICMHYDAYVNNLCIKGNKLLNCDKPPDGYPSCLHTTLASLIVHPVDNTTPHTELEHTSTVPSDSTAPPINLTSPLEQAVQNHIVL